jgi:seryl-tRNA synthetase
VVVWLASPDKTPLLSDELGELGYIEWSCAALALEAEVVRLSQERDRMHRRANGLSHDVKESKRRVERLREALQELLAEVNRRIEHGESSNRHLDYVRDKLSALVASPDKPPEANA